MNALLTIGLLMLGGLKHGALPRFEDFSVAATPSQASKSPILSTPFYRQFKTMIRKGAARGPNFAGHYSIATWGCGTSCVSLVVVDNQTGRIFDGPSKILTYGISLSFADGTKTADENFHPVSFRENSRLLITRACPDDPDSYAHGCALSYLEWRENRFFVLRRIAAKLTPPDAY